MRKPSVQRIIKLAVSSAFLLLTCSCWLPSATAQSLWTHVGTATPSTETSGTSCAVTISPAPVAGNTIWVGIISGNDGSAAPAISSVKDGNGNSFTLTPNSPSGTYGSQTGSASLAYMLSAPSNISPTITVTFASAIKDGTCLADSFQVASGYTPIFDTDAAGSGNSTTINTPSVTPATSNELFYSVVIPNAAITAVGSPWTVSPNVIFDGDSGGPVPADESAAAYDLSVSSALAVDMTASTAGVYDSMEGAIKAISSGGGCGTSLGNGWAVCQQSVNVICGSQCSSNAGTATFGSNMTAGHNLIVAAVICADASCGTTALPTLTPSDSASDRFVVSPSGCTAVDSGHILACIWYVASAGATNSVTVTCSTSNCYYLQIAMAELSGGATTSPFDQDCFASPAVSTGTKSCSGGSTTNANDLFYGAFFTNYSGNTISPGSGFTQLGNTSNLYEHEAESVTSTQTFTVSWNFTDGSANVIQLAGVAIKASAGGGGGTVANPTISPSTGTYSSPQTITVSDSTSGATICVRTDGGTPTANTAGTCDSPATAYASGAQFPLTIPSGGATVKALGTLAGDTNSSVVTNTYSLAPQAAEPAFSPNPGTYTGAQTVTISTTSSGAVICWNTTGAPATNSAYGCTTGTVYSGPVTVSATETLYAVAGGTGYSDSMIDSGSYTINTGPQVYYYLQDSVGTRVITDSSGNVVEQQGTYPYGESWYSASSEWVFTSYQRDSESANDYAMAREYVNRLGRFASLDPLAGDTVNPQSLNQYPYVTDDPINWIDPGGSNQMAPGSHGENGGSSPGSGSESNGGWGSDPTVSDPIISSVDVYEDVFEAESPNAWYGQSLDELDYEASEGEIANLGSFYLGTISILSPAPLNSGAGTSGGVGSGYRVNLKILNKCLSKMGIKTTINSFTPSTPGGYGKASGTGEDAFSGGGYVVPITVTNDAHTYNAAQVGQKCNLPAAFGCTLSASPYTNYTNNNNNAYGTVSTQVWELGNSLWVIQAGSSLIPVPTGKDEPGRVLENCVKGGHGIQAN